MAKAAGRPTFIVRNAPKLGLDLQLERFPALLDGAKPDITSIKYANETAFGRDIHRYNQLGLWNPALPKPWTAAHAARNLRRMLCGKQRPKGAVTELGSPAPAEIKLMHGSP